jgi:hypothetical protein
MKKFVSAIAAMALVVPTVASAATASEALSLKSAALQPVRASAKPGKAKAVSTPLILLGLAAAVGAIVIIADNSDSN